MANMAHIAETAGLLLLAYAAGAVVGFGLRRLVSRTRPSRATAQAVPSPEVLPANVPVFAAPAAAPTAAIAIVPASEPVVAPVAADDVISAQPTTVDTPEEVSPELQPVEISPPAEIAAAPLPAAETPADHLAPPRMPARSVGAMFIQIEADLASDQPVVSEDDARLDLPVAKPLTEIDIAQSPVERVLAALSEDDEAIVAVSEVPTVDSEASDLGSTPADDAPAAIEVPAVVAVEADQPSPANDPLAAMEAGSPGAEAPSEPTLPDVSPDDAEAAAMLAVEGAAPVRRRRRPQPVAAIVEVEAQDANTPAAPPG
jgi:hypothetical protein